MEKICLIENCIGKVYAKNFCGKHYQRYRAHGDPNVNLIKREKNKCKVEYCNILEQKCGYCDKHYRRFRKYGDPNKTNMKYGDVFIGPQKIESICRISNCDNTKIRAQNLCDKHYRGLKKKYKGKCQMDNCDIQCDRSFIYCNKHYQRQLKYGNPLTILHAEKGYGTINDCGYKVIYKMGHPNANSVGRILEHRYIMSQMLGRPLEKNENVHHINGNKLDNRPENLELWIKSQPCGQRLQDIIAWARNILKIYEKEYEEKLKEKVHILTYESETKKKE